MRILFPVLPLLAVLFSCNQPQSRQSAASVFPLPSSGPPVSTGHKIGGLTFVAPPEPFPANPMPAVQASGAGWIAVVPYAFLRPGTSQVIFKESGGQWWGERPEGVRETIRLAHEAGIKVMMKPQVWIPGAWTGALDFDNEADWNNWEQSFERYILRFAALADSAGTDLLCIATEFNTAIRKRPDYWRSLIGKVKAVYKGKITYSANWDDWDKVPFWSELDYIGLGGYFPLVAEKTPSVEALKAAWQPIRERLHAHSTREGKPVLFTEFGYLSVDSCGWRNWELERGIEGRSINQQAQANCYEALFSTFHNEPWWAGGFLWKWFPNMRGHEGYPERDYTPQGKVGEATVRKWYQGFR